MLRQTWEKAKSDALKEFKKKAPIGNNPHMEAPAAFPVKFKEDLGPTLDKWEKAKPSVERDKLAGKAVAVIGTYMVDVDRAKAQLGDDAHRTLTGRLKAIRTDIQKGQGQH